MSSGVATSNILAIDTETTGVTFFDTPFSVQFAEMDADGVHTEFYLVERDGDEIRRRIKAAEELVFHNAKFDIQKLALVELLDPDELDPYKVFDTECLAHLLDEHRRKGLKFLAREILGEDTDEEDEIRKARRKHKLTKADGYDKLYAAEPELVERYARKDAEFTIRLHDKLRSQVESSENLSRLLRLEQRLTFTLLRMERRGMGIAVEYVEETSKRYASEALALELAIRDEVGIESFNPNSPKQLTEAFLGLGVELASTNKATLASMEEPLARNILKLRTLRKMHGTYLKPMLDEQRDGILHPSYRQHGTRTGRMSSGEAER